MARPKAQMLDMLAQAWPKKYVHLMERKIDEFKARLLKTSCPLTGSRSQ